MLCWSVHTVLSFVTPDFDKPGNMKPILQSRIHTLHGTSAIKIQFFNSLS